MRLVRLLLKENRRLTSNNERLQRQRDQAVAVRLELDRQAREYLAERQAASRWLSQQ